jgi:hypothetical protein
MVVRELMKGVTLLAGAIQPGDTVRVHHPLGTPLATVTKLPFVERV